MGFIVDVDENENRKIIRYARYPLFMWCMFSGIAIGIFGENLISWAWFAAAPLLIIAFAMAIPCWKFNGEVKRAMRTGSVKVSGSKWSFSNPLTIEITKGNNSQPKVGQVSSEAAPSASPDEPSA